MAVETDTEIAGAEKLWGLLIAILAFPVGLIALVGLLAGRAWARWVGLALGVVAAAAGVAVAIWLVFVLQPETNTSYPFGPWFAILAAIYALLGALAARAFLRAIRTSREP